jgi:hypothetical protein
MISLQQLQQLQLMGHDTKYLAYILWSVLSLKLFNEQVLIKITAIAMTINN